ncbi:Bug family tripartite tricarboxylate transporter substrate binding protein [Rhodovarius crocodyli]|uniref:Bug family tripartite tricarboxylate transporter substrate binding protein n=1 Tax=Rhodovarius crocodyli TaxID=1979269 RepID=UPI0013E2A8F1|nr:tripartite tricarboxylate transporter substrate-binding protein [Rhodovarius crocodyli]
MIKITRRAAMLGTLATPALAQESWPARTVRVIVPWAPGGTADIVARLIFTSLSNRLGKPFVVENRSGAGGTVGAAAVAQAAPDGYTILHDGTGISITPALFPQLTYDPRRDFLPVFRPITVPQLVLVNPSLPARDIASFIALAKNTPNRLDAASAGSGSLQHLVMELFAQRAGVQFNHVPYRGGAPAVNDLISGQVQVFFGNVNVSAPFVRDGALRALAHTGSGRLTSLPDVPPLSETLPGFETSEWNGVFLPKGTPAPIVTALNRALNEAIQDPEVAARLRAGDLQATPNTPEEFAAFFEAQSSLWQGFVREHNIRLG